MKKWLAAILGLCLYYQWGWGQSVLQFRYHDGFRVEGVGLVEASNGEIILIGNYYYADLSSDIIIARMHSNGQLVWQYRYGGLSYSEYARDIIRTTDGHYLVVGEQHPQSADESEILLLNIDEEGNLAWSRTYGGTGADLASDVLPGKSGSYLIAGSTNALGAGDQDFYAINIDPAGNILWAKTYGAPGLQRCFAADTTDTGYILAGVHDGIGDSQRAYACHIDADGQLIWSKTLDGPEDDWIFGVHYRPQEPSLVFLGYTSSYGAGQLDNFIYKTDMEGQVIWQRTYGSEHIDFLLTATPTSDGGYLTSGGEDFYTTKIEGNGQLDWYYQYKIRPPESPFRDLPAGIRELSSGDIAIVGKTRLLADATTQIYFVKVPYDGSRACFSEDDINVLQLDTQASSDSVDAIQNSGGSSSLIAIDRTLSELAPFDLCAPVSTADAAGQAPDLPFTFISIPGGFSLSTTNPADAPLAVFVTDASGREVYRAIQSDATQIHLPAVGNRNLYVVYGRSASGRIFSFKWLAY